MSAELDILAKARGDLLAAERAEGEAKRAHAEARAHTKKCRLRLADAMNELLDGVRQPRIPFEAAPEPAALTPDDRRFLAEQQAASAAESPDPDSLLSADGTIPHLGSTVSAIASAKSEAELDEIAERLKRDTNWSPAARELAIKQLAPNIERRRAALAAAKPEPAAVDPVTLEMAGAFVRATEPESVAVPTAPATEFAPQGDPHDWADLAPTPPLPFTKLSALDGFPDAVLDALLPTGISTVETLLEGLQGKAYIGAEMPLRNRVVAFLIGENRDIKLKHAEYAADAVAEFVEPSPKPVKTVDVLNLPPIKRDRKSDPALNVACPKCGAEIGAKCTDYRGKGKATCADRLNPPAATPAPAKGSGTQLTIDVEPKPPRFHVEAGNEPFDENEPNVLAWHVVDTSKKVAHERYCDCYRTEEAALAKAALLEEAANSDPPEKKSAKAKRKAGAK